MPLKRQPLSKAEMVQVNMLQKKYPNVGTPVKPRIMNKERSHWNRISILNIEAWKVSELFWTNFKCMKG